MPMPKNQMQMEMSTAWSTYLDSLESSLELLDRQIKEAGEMSQICTDEWCEATEHYIDDLGNALFTIHEPRWLNKEDSDRLKRLKRRVYDLYANYRQIGGRSE